MALQLSRGLLSEAAPLIGAGCGRFLVERLARRLDRPYRDFGELIAADAARRRSGPRPARPAVAVALLLAGEAEAGNE